MLNLLCFFEISGMFVLAIPVEVCVWFLFFSEPIGIKNKGRRSKCRLRQN